MADLEGGEPHEPVEAVMVGRDQARPPLHISRLALELVLYPQCRGVLRISAGGALEHYLRPLLGDAGDCGNSTGIRDWISFRMDPTSHPYQRTGYTGRGRGRGRRGLPAEGPIGVDDAERVKGRIHHLPGAEQVEHHWDAEGADENGQGDVQDPTDLHAWWERQWSRSPA